MTAGFGEHLRSCKNTPYRVWILAMHQQWGACHSFDTLEQMSSLWRSLRKWRTKKDSEVRTKENSEGRTEEDSESKRWTGSSVCIQPAWSWVGAALWSGACQADFGSWLMFLCAHGHCSSLAGVFGSGVSCTHIFLQWKVNLLLSLKGSKGTAKELSIGLSNFPLQF